MANLQSLIVECERLIKLAPDKATELTLRNILADLRILCPTKN